MNHEELREVVRQQWRAHRLGDPSAEEIAATINVAIAYAAATRARQVPPDIENRLVEALLAAWRRPDDMRAAVPALASWTDQELAELAEHLGALPRVVEDEADGTPTWEWRLVEEAA